MVPTYILKSQENVNNKKNKMHELCYIISYIHTNNVIKINDNNINDKN